MLFFVSFVFVCAAFSPTNFGFCSSESAYDEQFAKRLAALSAAAYATTPMPCVKRWMPGNWLLQAIKETDCDIAGNTCGTFTIVSYAREEVVVVFRGTISKMQLIMQGWQSLKPGNDFFGIGKVNQYFDGALKSLWPNIEKTLQTFKGFNVTFTGHSLGGALASLAAARSVIEGFKRSNQLRLYTFGQPRVGNAAFASKHKELVPNSFRIVFREDFVAHIPPCSLNDEDDDKPCDPTISTHFHHGTEIWYSKQMPRLESHQNSDSFTICAGQPRGEDFGCSETIHFDLTHLVGDHYDHKHYFGRSLGNFGELGCDPNLDDEDAELVGRVKEEQKKKCQSRCGAPFFSSAKSLGCQNGLFGAKEDCGPLSFGTRYICAICE